MDTVPIAMEKDTVPNGDSAAITAPTDTAVVTPATTQPSKLNELTESLKLEHQVLRVPFENYKKSIRANYRIIEEKLSSVITGVSDYMCTDGDGDADAENLNTLVSRLQGLKRKLEEGSRTENAQRCCARLDADSIVDWNAMKLNRILVEHMLRMSYRDSAKKLAESSNMLDFVDIEVFDEAKKVISSLQSKEVASALAWCAENRARLKKTKSTFEFQLRLQEFIELVRADNNMKAITYARNHLAPWATTHLKELQRVMGTLVFKSNTECETYKDLFDAKRWDILVDQFKQEFFKLYGMPLEPLLNINLQTGLSALKTPFCHEPNCTKADPLSQESFRKSALPLPFSKVDLSKIVCYISKELMTPKNPPLVLPNGNVYSTKALEEMAAKNNGKITCPRTGDVCNFTELTKLYNP